MDYPLYGYFSTFLGGWPERNSCHTREILKKKYGPYLRYWLASGLLEDAKKEKNVISEVPLGFMLVCSLSGTDKKSLELDKALLFIHPTNCSVISTL